MSDYGKVPANATLQPKPFKANIADERLDACRQLIKLAPIGPADFNNSHPTEGLRYGLRREWLKKAKKVWENDFDWRKHEARINSYPNFTVPVPDESGSDIDVHFIALFSQNTNAQPVALYHGWPGSVIDFFGILDMLKSKYSPQELPYHIIVPSLPGYAFSGSPPVDVDFDIPRAAHCLDKLMTGLGLEGYVATGGDLGSGISRTQADECKSCKAFHLNMLILPPPAEKDTLPLEMVEKQAMPRGMEFRQSGMAYALEHGTRGGTIGLALQSSPVALLCWIAEKYLAWSDEDLSLDQILASVTLYWLTDTFPRCLYPYRRFATGREPSLSYINKPLGYSWFPKEIFPVPVSWAGTTADLVYYRRHEKGGHFAALERPGELLADIEAFVAMVH